MKLNWFSPLPPSDSPVARYTGKVLLPLAKATSVTAWTDGSNMASDLEPPVRVRTYNSNEVPWADINAADATIYHLGKNAEINEPIWRMFQQQPGIVVLHQIADRQRLDLSGLRNATAVGLHAPMRDAVIRNPTSVPVVFLPAFELSGENESTTTVNAHVQALLQLVEVSLKRNAAQAVCWISERAGRAMNPWFSDSAAAILLPSLAQTISRIFDEH